MRRPSNVRKTKQVDLAREKEEMETKATRDVCIQYQFS